MVSLIFLMEFTTGVDRLLAQLAHKNVRVKEHVLQVMCLIQAKDPAAFKPIPSICGKIGALLADPQSSVRAAASETLAKLHPAFGNTLQVRLTLCLTASQLVADRGSPTELAF